MSLESGVFLVLGVPESVVALHKDTPPLNIEKLLTMSYFFRRCLWEMTSEDSGLKMLVWHKPQHETTNNTLPAKQSA